MIMASAVFAYCLCVCVFAYVGKFMLRICYYHLFVNILYVYHVCMIFVVFVYIMYVFHFY